MVAVNVDVRTLMLALEEAGYDLHALAAVDRKAHLPKNTTVGILAKAADDPAALFPMADVAKIALALGTPLSSISPDHAAWAARGTDPTASLAADSSTINYTLDPEDNDTDSHTQI